MGVLAFLSRYGTLEADRFEIRDGGDVLRFEGRVKVTVQPQRDDGKRS